MAENAEHEGYYRCDLCHDVFKKASGGVDRRHSCAATKTFLRSMARIGRQALRTKRRRIRWKAVLLEALEAPGGRVHPELIDAMAHLLADKFCPPGRLTTRQKPFELAEHEKPKKT